MPIPRSSSPQRHVVSACRLLLVLTLGALLVAGCGDDDTASSGTTAGGTAARTAEIAPPDAIADAGKLTFCSELAFPPVEYIDNGEVKGSDIDVGDDIAKRMGVRAQYDNTGFDGIIPALLGGKCDAIISGVNVTPERAEQVHFIEYMKIGQSIMVPPGNPDGIATLEDLSGRSVAVSIGSTNKDYLETASKQLVEAGKDPIDINPFPKDTAGVEALRTGKLDAYFADASIVAFYIQQSPESFELAGKPIRAVIDGIAVRKDDTELQEAIQQAVDAMYEDGTLPEILARWNLGDSVL